MRLLEVRQQFLAGEVLGSIIVLNITGNSKQRMVRSGPTSVLLSINKEDLGVMETKNIVFHPHGVQVSTMGFFQIRKGWQFHY